MTTTSTNILSALNAGSGIDTKQLVSDLVAAERAPRQKLLDDRSATVEARISALGTFRSSLDALVSALDTRVRSGSLSGVAAVSDPSAIGLTVDPGRTVDRQSIQINQLARAQSLSSVPIADAAAPVGQGSLTLRFGTVAGTDAVTGFVAGSIPDLVVTIGPGEDSLTGLKNAINDAAARASAPIQAQIISDASGSRLVLRGQSGEASGFTIDTSGDPALEAFAFNQSLPGGMTRNQTALDAEIMVEGLAVRRPGNTIGDLIEGATLSLFKAQPGTVLTIEAAHNPADMSDAVNGFASALNELVSLGRSLTAAATSTSSAGALASDSATRNALNALMQIGTRQIIAPAGTAPSTLSQIGLQVQRDGRFSVDAATLSRAIDQHPDAVQQIMTELVRKPTLGNAGGALQQISATFDVVLDGAAGSKTALQAERDAIAADRVRLESTMTSYQNRLTTQFSALDTSVNAYKSIQSFLKQQIDLWTQSGKN
jgi:flagellar hook-associated protein 2